MSGGQVEDIKKHAKVYWLIGGGLLVLTLVTVAVSALDLGKVGNIALALFIATFKSSLVACYFMHLISEKKLIYWILILTVIFFIFLMLIPVITVENNFGVRL